MKIDQLLSTFVKHKTLSSTEKSTPSISGMEGVTEQKTSIEHGEKLIGANLVIEAAAENSSFSS